MAPKVYGLSENEYALFKELMREHQSQTLNTRQRPRVDPDDFVNAPEVLLVRNSSELPGATIGTGTSDLNDSDSYLGTGLCETYQVLDLGTGAQPTATGGETLVYNPYSDPVPDGTLFPIARDKFGRWLSLWQNVAAIANSVDDDPPFCSDCPTIDDVLIWSTLATPSGLIAESTSGGSLSASTTYRYVVTGTDDCNGETVQSETVVVSTTVSNRTIKLSWTAGTRFTGYKVYRTTSTTFTSPSLLAVLGDVTSYTDDGSATLQFNAPPQSGSVGQWCGKSSQWADVVTNVCLFASGVALPWNGFNSSSTIGSMTFSQLLQLLQLTVQHSIVPILGSPPPPYVTVCEVNPTTCCPSTGTGTGSGSGCCPPDTLCLTYFRPGGGPTPNGTYTLTQSIPGLGSWRSAPFEFLLGPPDPVYWQLACDSRILEGCCDDSGWVLQLNFVRGGTYSFDNNNYYTCPPFTTGLITSEGGLSWGVVEGACSGTGSGSGSGSGGTITATSLGNNFDGSSSVSSLSIPGHTVPANTLLIVKLVVYGNATPTVTFAGLPMTLLATEPTGAAGGYAEIWYLKMVATTTGDVVATYSPVGGAIIMTAEYISGLASNTPDQHHQANGTSNSPDTGSITTTVANEYITAVFQHQTANNVFGWNTPLIGEVNLCLFNSGSLGYLCFQEADYITSSTTTISGILQSISGSPDWAGIIASFK